MIEANPCTFGTKLEVSLNLFSIFDQTSSV